MPKNRRAQPFGNTYPETQVCMQVLKRWALALGLVTAVLATTGCGTISTLGKLEDGAGGEAMRMWDRWVQAEGDIAVATTWEAKVKDGIKVSDIEEIFRQVAAEHNIRDVGTLPLSKELEARSGKKRTHADHLPVLQPFDCPQHDRFQSAHGGLHALPRVFG